MKGVPYSLITDPFTKNKKKLDVSALFGMVY